MKDHWQDGHLLEAPLRPNQEVVDAIIAAVGEQSASVLLLGVTPELVEPFECLTTASSTIACSHDSSGI